jgi:MFS family permease
MAASKHGYFGLVVALVIADVTAAFETTMVFTAMRQLFEEYSNPTLVGWLLTAYLLVSAAAAAICGRLGDMYGRRAVLLAMLGCAVIGSLVSAFAPTLEGVIFGRALQGLSGAILPLCLGIARQNVPEKVLPTVVGIVTGSAAIGGALGMLVGGAVVDTFGWRHIFTASSLLGLVSFVACMIAIPRSPTIRKSGQLDLVGGLLFVPAVAGALLAVSNAREWALDWRFFGLLLVSALLFCAWLWHELRHPNPLLDVRLLARRDIWLPNAAMAFCALGAFQFSQLALLLMQQPVWTGVGIGLTATVAALLKLPGNFAAAALSPLTGFLCGRIGGPTVVAVGMTVTAIASFVLIAIPDNLTALVAITVIISIGTSTAYIAVPNILLAASPADRTSETAGLSSVVRSMSMAVGAQLMIVLLATMTVSDPSQGPGVFPTLEAYQTVLLAIGVASLVSAGLALASRRPAPAAGNAAPA